MRSQIKARHAPVGPRRQLGAELQRLRSQAGLSGRTLARRLGLSQSKVSRIEMGTSLPTTNDVTAWAEAVGARADAREHLLLLTEAAHTQVVSWRETLRNRDHLQDEIAARESRAQLIRTFQSSLVPGLLQTADYARRVFALAQVPYTDMAASAALAGRLHRQLALYDQHRRFEFVITDAALRWNPYPDPVLAAQYDRIASLSTLDNVSIGIIPDGEPAIAAIPHSFIIYDGDHRTGCIVTTETLHADIVVEEPDDVMLYQQRWDLLREMAIFGDDARRLLMSMATRACHASLVDQPIRNNHGA